MIVACKPGTSGPVSTFIHNPIQASPFVIERAFYDTIAGSTALSASTPASYFEPKSGSYCFCPNCMAGDMFGQNSLPRAAAPSNTSGQSSPEPFDGDDDASSAAQWQSQDTTSPNPTSQPIRNTAPLQKRRRVTRACDECRRKVCRPIFSWVSERRVGSRWTVH